MYSSGQRKPQFYWQVGILFLLGWPLIEVPVRMAFNYPSTMALHLIDISISLIFLIDVIYHLKKGQFQSSAIFGPAAVTHAPHAKKHHHGPTHAHEQEHQHDHEQEHGHDHDHHQEVVPDVLYQKTKFFWLDLWATVPFSALALLHPYLETSHLLTLMGLLHLLRLPRIVNTHFTLESFIHIPKVLRTFLTLGMCLIFVHWVSCFWIIVSPDRDITDDLTQYNKAIYWAVTTLATVGYGDITPYSNWGRLYTMCIMILGVGFYGIVVGYLTQVILQANRHRDTFKKKLEDLALFMRHYQIPLNLQHQVFSFYNHLIGQRLTEDDSGLIADLPKALQSELQLFMNLKLISGVPLFDSSEHECLRLIANALEQVYFSPGDLIIKKDEIGNEMFIIGHGQVDILNDQNRVVAILQKGQFFGEMALLRELPRNANVRAKSYCDLYKLNKPDFLRILERHPSLKENIQKVIEKRARPATPAPAPEPSITKDDERKAS